MQTLNLRSIVLATLCLLSDPLLAGEITAGGEKLQSFLDGQKVEEHWLAGKHIEWRTGEPDGKAVSETGPHSHCSAFAASVCERLGIYLLRPPEHSQFDLANAQFDWLREKGDASGWTPVRDAIDAEDHANRGDMVVAVLKAPEGKHGHIAIVRPSPKSAEKISIEGPDETQAGIENFASTNLKTGFRYHAGAWDHRQIQFYSHPVNAFPLPKK